MRYGSLSNTKKQTVKINGSVRFALLTVILKNVTVTVEIAVKNGMVNKTENGTVRWQIRTPLLYYEIFLKELLQLKLIISIISKNLLFFQFLKPFKLLWLLGKFIVSNVWARSQLKQKTNLLPSANFRSKIATNLF